MTNERTSAVQTAKDDAGLDLPTQDILSIARVGEVERIEQAVMLPPIYQYSISRYGAAPKVMLTSDAYDFLNRSMGVQLYQPDWVNDEHGQRVRNPIHRADYIYLRLIGIWYNDIGQMVSYREDVEVDFNLVWHDARINSKSARVEMDDKGMPVFGPGGAPVVRLEAQDELKALKALSQLRTFGLRYAQTVAKTRILKTASGVRSLPIAQPRPFPIRVVGFRDKMTPDERAKRAEQDLGAVFGNATRLRESDGLNSEELAEMQGVLSEDETEDIERDLVQAAQLVENPDLGAEDEDPERIIRRVGPQDFDMDEVDRDLGLTGDKPKRSR